MRAHVDCSVGCVQFLPAPYQELMLGEHSPIKHFYPRTFDVDMNGKKASWEVIMECWSVLLVCCIQVFTCIYALTYFAGHRLDPLDR